MCGQVPQPMGTSCSQGFCDANGSCVQCLDATDCPDTQNECVLKACTNGTCGGVNAPMGFSCSSGEDHVCDGFGNCI
jgi:hypothetical protein